MSAATDLELYKCATLQVFAFIFFFQSALFAVEREKELAGGRRCVRDEGGRNWFCVYAANPQTLKKALASIFSFFFSFVRSFSVLLLFHLFCRFPPVLETYSLLMRLSLSHSTRSVSGGRSALSASFGTGVEARQ